MGKKEIVILFFTFMLTMNVYGHNVDDGMITWRKKESEKNFKDTIQIDKQYISVGLFRVSTEKLYVGDTSFLCYYLLAPTILNSSLPTWIIHVYKQVNDKWKLVGDGSYVSARKVNAALDTLRNRIVFYTKKAECEFDRTETNIRKDEIIGEVKISDL